jgi:hypothetical protein
MATATKTTTKAATSAATKAGLNFRAKLTPQLSAFCKQNNFNVRTWLSVNPKTEKSKEETRILHLAPSIVSGHNVCPGAGNCAKICLHFAGIPYLMGGKKTCRVRKTLAFFDDRQLFLELTATAILYNRSLLSADELLAIRLNGTSDIMWETLEFTVSPELSRMWYVKFGMYIVPTAYTSIVHMFAHYPEFRIRFYDYTKVKHNWQECKDINYHLTFSFDGYGNRSNVKIASDAVKNGVNIAAAFNIKKGKALPPVAYLCNRGFKVVDGDLTDYRPGDPKGFTIIGLRFKLPHGIAYTPAERDAFCLSADRMGGDQEPA